MAEFICRVCGSEALDVVPEYAALPRVTSDCKPWPAGGTMTACLNCGAAQKRPDAAWFNEIKRIYDGYQIYKLSGGSEQVIFDASGSATPRSRALVDFVVTEAKPASSGALIDIGCGNGAALVNFSRALPSWSMHGSELSDAPLDTLRALPNFGGFYKDEPRNLKGRFDIVTMIHALEHMPDPLHTLIDSAALLNPGGRLFVDIPNVETSIFDLVIADHMMHFSSAHLGYLAQRAGLKAEVLRDDILPKEITMLAGKGSGTAPLPDAKRGLALVRRHVAWLRRVLDDAHEAMENASSFGIFGTSISGMWLYGAMREQVAFFVDEDRTRIGNMFDGKPIVAPQDAPVGSTIFLPLNPDSAVNVHKRLQSRIDARLVQPCVMDRAA
ncbi:MAG TPA: class I SAM-dependent methyltransferase [Stellaceae bacterium]|nr:class I SAM-dependent methyltransferase [Stellaceae bacterium]